MFLVLRDEEAIMENPFSPSFLASQRRLLLQHKEKVLNKMAQSKREEMRIGPEEMAESGDFANSQVTQNIYIGLQERDIHILREIDEALLRIENHSYGFCMDTGEPISEKRLEKIPWTRLSLEAAEALEEGMAAAA